MFDHILKTDLALISIIQPQKAQIKGQIRINGFDKVKIYVPSVLFIHAFHSGHAGGEEVDGADQCQDDKLTFLLVSSQSSIKS
jgi:hypothetical protein